MTKHAFIDVETTSKNPWKGAITELACIIESDGKEVGTFFAKLRPHTGAYVEDEALSIQGITRADLDSSERELSSVAFNKFLRFMECWIDPYAGRTGDKLFFIAHNAKFDTEYMEAWFKVNVSRYYASYFYRPSICTYMLSALHMQTDWRNMADHKLKTIFDRLPLTLPNDGHLHSALYDVQLCRAIYKHFAPAQT